MSEPEATEEAPEDSVEAALGFLDTILKQMGLDIEVTGSRDGKFLRIVSSGPDASLLVPGRGASVSSEVLDALQLVIGRSNAAGDANWMPVIDAGGYRDARMTQLSGVAERVSKSVIQTGQSAHVYGMNSFDRRAIHLELADHEQVHTDSQGYGVFRTLIVAPGAKES